MQSAGTLQVYPIIYCAMINAVVQTFNASLQTGIEIACSLNVSLDENRLRHQTKFLPSNDHSHFRDVCNVMQCKLVNAICMCCITESLEGHQGYCDDLYTGSNSGYSTG